MTAKILEAAMLIFFGISWPVNLAKSIRTGSTKSKSLLFLILIDLGYIAGNTPKLVSTTFVWATDWWVFLIYAVNFTFVTSDLAMWFVNRAKEKKAAE